MTKTCLIYLLLLALSAALPATSAHPCPDLPGSPPSPISTEHALPRFETGDIELFWSVLDRASPENAARLFQEAYLDKGSAGLRGFTRLRIGDGKQLAAQVRAAPRYYAGLRTASAKVGEQVPAMQSAFRCLQQIYPEATLPDVYFLVGRMNSAGTLDGRNLYIGVDMFGKGAAPMDELGPWHQAVVSPIERLPYIVAHELVHFQQRYPADDSVLARSLNEGIADFIAELIAGAHINPHLHQYGNPREAELWERFQQDMNGKQLTHWLYQGERAPPGVPADLGYYMGYRIAAVYYEEVADKRQAIRDMFTIRDFRAFLAASRYGEKLARRQRESAGSAPR